MNRGCEFELFVDDECNDVEFGRDGVSHIQLMVLRPQGSFSFMHA